MHYSTSRIDHPCSLRKKNEQRLTMERRTVDDPRNENGSRGEWLFCPRADIRRVAAYGLESTAVGRRRRPVTVCNRSPLPHVPMMSHRVKSHGNGCSGSNPDVETGQS